MSLRFPPTIKPFPVGPAVQVRPYDGELRRTDGELALYDSLATEQVRQDGARAHYFSLNVSKSDINPVYDESTERHFDGPYEMSVYVEWPQSNPEVKSEGLEVQWNTRMWIPRAEIERTRCPLPLEGDIVQVWRTTFFDTWSVTGDEPQKGGYFFTVIVSNDEGHLYDQPGFVGFELTIARRTPFTPERRIDTRYRRADP